MDLILTNLEKKYIENKRKQQNLKKDLITNNEPVKEKVKVQSKNIKQLPIKRRRRSKEEMIEYRRLKDQRLLKKKEYKELNNKVKSKKKEYKQTGPKRALSKYILFQQNFSKNNKGVKNYRQELSKAWKLQKSS